MTWRKLVHLLFGRRCQHDVWDYHFGWRQCRYVTGHDGPHLGEP